MLRYMAVVPVTRKRLQLVGIGALCLTCKHEEVMIPNMNDFIYICDNAYDLDALLQIEVEILSALHMQLHVPTAHDMLLPLLARSARRHRSYPDAIDSQAAALVVRVHAAARPGALPRRPARWRRARARVGTLGALLSRGVAETASAPAGGWRATSGGDLRDRARAGCAVLTSGRA